MFDDSADFLKTKTTTGQLIGSLNNELTCKGESFTTPYSKTPLTLNDYIYVELKTSYVNSGYYYKFKMQCAPGTPQYSSAWPAEKTSRGAPKVSQDSHTMKLESPTTGSSNRAVKKP